MALFPLLKTARVASGENSLHLMRHSILTYHWFGVLPPVTKFFREILADQISVAELKTK
jgi:hypothetical protein